MDVSRVRQRLGALREQLGALLELFLERAPAFEGSLYEMKTRCGKPGCKCASGEYRHHIWCVSFKEGERKCTRVVGEEIRSEVEALTERYRRLRQGRRELQRIFEQILSAVDSLLEARCREGRKRYNRLAAQAKSVKKRRKGP